MERENFIKQCEECGKMGDCITIETNDGEYTIEDGENFLGGIQNTWESELLGHVAYDSIKSIAIAVYSYITNELNETINEVY